ncbi:hypothetical protein [Bacillus sp. FSL M8-0168]|uniref:hypothetical protein n=1 Tax=Bacillus sp. FSL M8-0168 TaxID=2921614 RepID=UPI0030FD222B
MIKKKTSVWKEAKLLFSGWGIVSLIFLLMMINVGYLYIVTHNPVLSFAFGIIGSVMLFFVLFVETKKLRLYQRRLNELLKYATNMTFFLQSGKNVLYSLEETKHSVDSIIHSDIQKTIDILKDKARLDTSHFEKYNFPALNQFHQILNIKYEKGGHARDMFKTVVKSMNFEISKRDDLYRKKKNRAIQVYMLLGLVISMPLILFVTTHNLYEQFLSMRLGSSIILYVFYMVILINIKRMQRTLNDVSVRL